MNFYDYLKEGEFGINTGQTVRSNIQWLLDAQRIVNLLKSNDPNKVGNALQVLSSWGQEQLQYVLNQIRKDQDLYDRVIGYLREKKFGAGPKTVLPPS